LRLSDDEIVVRDYLKATNYDTVEDWALDSNYCYNDDYDLWYDDDGNPVDIYSMLLVAIGYLI